MIMLNYRTLALLFVIGLPVALAASPAGELQSAAEDGKVAFLLVTEPGAAGVEQARGVLEGALAQVAGSVMIEVDRADNVNAPLIAEYRLSGASVPLILVFASNGAMAGGNLASGLTTEKLVNMLPSPKKAEVLQALQTGQGVFLTAYREEMTSRSDVSKYCASACGLMKGKCVSIDVDMDDLTETTFLQQLRVNMQSTEPVTVVINAQGQVTGSFNGPADVGKLVQAANTKAGGCCPPSSGKSCAPAPKKKDGK
jgi:hypothetical protein